MAVAVPSKYALKSLHEEIALVDRKLAHLEKYETFSTDKERLAASAKISLKRSQLVRAAQVMTDAGIEFTPSELPTMTREAKESVAATEAAAPEAFEMRASHTAEPSHQGSVLDFRNSISEYKKRRKLTA